MTVGGLEDGFQLGLLGGQGVEVGIRLGVGGIDLVQAGLGLLDLTDRFLDHLTNRLLGIKFRFLRQITHIDTGHRTRFTFDLGIDAGHDAQQRRFTRTVQTEHADLGAGKERQGDVLEDFTLGRHDLADPMHGVDVLSHGGTLGPE